MAYSTLIRSLLVPWGLPLKLLKKSKLKLKFENKLINKTGRLLVIKPFNEEKDKDIVINEIIESYYLPKEVINSY